MIILAIFKVLNTTHYDTPNVMCKKKKYFLTLSLCLFLTNIMWSLYLMSPLSVNLKCVMLFFLLFFFWWKCLLIIKSLDYHILLYIECLVKKIFTFFNMNLSLWYKAQNMRMHWSSSCTLTVRKNKHILHVKARCMQTLKLNISNLTFIQQILSKF